MAAIPAVETDPIYAKKLGHVTNRAVLQQMYASGYLEFRTPASAHSSTQQYQLWTIDQVAGSIAFGIQHDLQHHQGTEHCLIKIPDDNVKNFVPAQGNCSAAVQLYVSNEPIDITQCEVVML